MIVFFILFSSRKYCSVFRLSSLTSLDSYPFTTILFAPYVQLYCSFFTVVELYYARLWIVIYYAIHTDCHLHFPAIWPYSSFTFYTISLSTTVLIRCCRWYSCKCSQESWRTARSSSGLFMQKLQLHGPGEDLRDVNVSFVDMNGCVSVISSPSKCNTALLSFFGVEFQVDVLTPCHSELDLWSDLDNLHPWRTPDYRLRLVKMRLSSGIDCGLFVRKVNAYAKMFWLQDQFRSSDW